MADLVVIGAGGHGRAIQSLMDPPVKLMTDEEFFTAPSDPKKVEVIVGIGDDAARERIFERVLDMGYRMGTCIAPNAFVARDALIGEGSVICAGAVIGARAVVGRNAIVNTLSSLDHDCVLGDHSQITAGVTVAGRVKIGRRCFLGLKSGVLEKLSLGDYVTVMAGALVTRDVPAHTLVGGVPARILRAGPENP